MSHSQLRALAKKIVFSRASGQFEVGHISDRLPMPPGSLRA